MRSPMGELCFAAHSRHAEAEMRALADQMVSRVGGLDAGPDRLSRLSRLISPATAR
jgi:hypothetical protein